MPRPLFDSEYIFGLHEPGGERIMLDVGRPGWIVFTEAVGSDPNDRGGKDFSPWSNRNLGVLCRINHGYWPDGTIPSPSRYAAFAQRCANYVANSRGCRLWIIGNEMNHWQERPQGGGFSLSAPTNGDSLSAKDAVAAAAKQVAEQLGPDSGRSGTKPESGASPTPPPPEHGAPSQPHSAPQEAIPASIARVVVPTTATTPPPPPAFLPAAAPFSASARSDGPGEPITPELYAQCFRLCRDAIRRVPGHAEDQVLIGAVAPWNAQTRYPGNEIGDWVIYFQDILRLLGPGGCDGVTLHTYTHGADPNLITSDATMAPPFQNRRYEFRAYMDFMNAIPLDMRHLPVYITETDEDVPWLDQNIGWVQRAYGEINWWNRQPGAQQIRSLVLYRWPRIDQWYIEGKGGVIADFQMALTNDYKWQEQQLPFPFRAGDTAKTTTIVNLRRTPGSLDKPPGDVIAQLAQGALATILSDQHQRKDGMIWWNVGAPVDGQTATGWVAQATAAGAPLLEKQPTTPPPSGTFAPGDLVQTLDIVRMRQTPGYVGKPPSDVIADLPKGTRLRIQRGPSKADNLDYWQASGKDAGGRDIVGWVAERSSTGASLLEKVTDPSFPSVPEPTFAIGDRVQAQALTRFRRTPGYVGKQPSDVIADLPPLTTGVVVAGPAPADGLTWWQLDMPIPGGSVQRGWAAEVDPNGVTLLRKASGTTPPPPPPGIARGDLLVALNPVRVRRTPGAANKPPEDVLGVFAPAATLNVNGGPQDVDGMTWWHVGGINSNARETVGWVAHKLSDGTGLIGPAPKLPNTNIPDRATATFLQSPTQTPFRITQLWGENPQIYSRFTYDGVPLRGHNGIDFAAPIGTLLTAVDAGVVAEAVYNDPGGFGNYVKLQHSWGESLYAHMDAIRVQPGQQLTRGQVIGTSGNTGFSGGPHLHFAIRINPYDRRDGWGGFSDPLPYMNPAEVLLPSYVLPSPALGVGVGPALSFSMPRPEALAAPDAAPPPHTLSPGLLPEAPGVRRP